MLSQVPEAECLFPKSSTQTVMPQTNRFLAALRGFIKLERPKMKTKLNHFALKSNLSLNALRSAFATLRSLSPRLTVPRQVRVDE